MARTPSHDTSAPLRTALMRIWAVIGLAIIAIGVLQVLGALSSAVLFLAVGCIFAFIASPIVNWLQRRRVPRPLAAMAALIAVAVGVVLVFSLILPVAIGQVVDLLRDSPVYISRLSVWFADFEHRFALVRNLSEHVDLASLISSLQGTFNQVVNELLLAVRNGIVPLVNNVASTLFTVFFGFVLAYWLACDYPKLNDEICRALGDDKATDYRLMMAVVGQSVGGYLRSMIISAIVRSTLAFAGFWLAGHPYAGVMAMFSGVLSFVPVVGPAFSAFIATVTGLFSSPSVALWTLVAAMVAQNVTDNVIAPKINESTMSIHPVLSLTALMIGSSLAGALGMMIAIPLAAVAKSLFIFYYEGRTGRQIVSYDGAIFKGTPYQDEAGDPVPAYDALGNDRFIIDSELIRAVDVPSAKAAPKPASSADDLSANPWERVMKRMLAGEGPRGSREPDETAARSEREGAAGAEADDAANAEAQGGAAIEAGDAAGTGAGDAALAEAGDARP
ncbi:MAG: AI-2E family transporter [Coriobacteriaceae bacterium]|nr:AI-2E family transporter [Coriobacteriaceae bacterium]